MNFSLSELETIFYDIQDIIGYFEQSEYDKRRNIIFLSNGDRLNYRVPKDCIAHLLGINTNYLTTTERFNNKSSFELLKEFSESAYKIHQLATQGIIKYDYLFSPHILNKIEAFRENIKINIFETEFVSKYEARKTYSISEQSQKYDYIIVKKYNDTGKYGLLCLVKNIDGYDREYYVPMSNQLYDNKEELDNKLKDLIQNQEITLLNGMSVSNVNIDYNKKYILQLDIKYSKFKKLREYKQICDCSIDVSSDFEYSLSETMKHMDNHFDDNSIIYEIARCIKNGTIIDVDSYRNTKLFNIIDAFNDFLCSCHSDENSTEVGSRYSEMKKELQKTKEQLLLTQNDAEKLNTENEILKIDNARLSCENQAHIETNQKILELLNQAPKPSK